MTRARVYTGLLDIIIMRRTQRLFCAQRLLWLKNSESFFYDSLDIFRRILAPVTIHKILSKKINNLFSTN